MAVFLSDTFTDFDGTILHNHTPDTGGTWVKRTGSGVVEVDTNEAVGIGDFTTSYTNGATPGGNEYDITCDYKPLNASAFSIWLARFADASNHYFARYAHALSDRMSIWKKVAGVWTELDFVTDSLTLGDWITVKFEIRDAAKKLYFGGAEKCSTADDTLTAAGLVGFGLDDDSRIDDFVADDAVAPPAENAFMQPMKVLWPK